MRTLYTILFFADTVSLACLSFLFLHNFDQGAPAGLLALIFAAIVASILLLVFLLKGYIKLPSDKEPRK
jgi:drug/metabolite transporter (DMT)-like permease